MRKNVSNAGRNMKRVKADETVLKILSALLNIVGASYPLCSNGRGGMSREGQSSINNNFLKRGECQNIGYCLIFPL